MVAPLSALQGYGRHGVARLPPSRGTMGAQTSAPLGQREGRALPHTTTRMGKFRNFLNRKEDSLEGMQRSRGTSLLSPRVNWVFSGMKWHK